MEITIATMTVMVYLYFAGEKEYPVLFGPIADIIPNC